MPRLTGYSVVGVRSDRFAVSEMDVQPAAGRAEAADHVGRGIGSKPRRHLPEAEASRLQQQFARQRSVELMQD